MNQRTSALNSMYWPAAIQCHGARGLGWKRRMPIVMATGTEKANDRYTMSDRVSLGRRG
jgi:hypothetical protein